MEKDILGNIDNRVLPAVDIEVIWHERNNFCRRIGRKPNYVMIHNCNKTSLLEEAQNATRCGRTCPINNHMCFGMKVIWTLDIGQNDVICTYSYRQD